MNCYLSSEDRAEQEQEPRHIAGVRSSCHLRVPRVFPRLSGRCLPNRRRSPHARRQTQFAVAGSDELLRSRVAAVSQPSADEELRTTTRLFSVVVLFIT